jgi:twitching motility protein PilT
MYADASSSGYGEEFTPPMEPSYAGAYGDQAQAGAINGADSSGGYGGGYGVASDGGAYGADGYVPDASSRVMPPGFKPSSGELRPFAAISGGKSALDIDDLLTYAVENGASDLHLANQLPPAIRVDGSIRPIEGLARLDNETIREMIFGILTQSLRERFEADKELDTSHSIMGVGRFRVNVFQQRGSIGSVLRAIPHEIPPFETLGLPEVVSSLSELRRGLVLVTGPTGSGKSTTLASLINIINRTKPLHIVTVEDPIEFLHTHDRAIVNQREVGSDTYSFSEALRHVLRQDPDVILVGEMRDIETISTALTAAETGHLVFATLHTQDAPQTVDRIIDVFPTNQQDQVRIQLAGSLEAVVTQQLIISATGLGRVPVAEVMMASPAIRNLIRSAKTHQIYSLMQTGGSAGMQTMDQGLARAVGMGKISEAIAFDRCHDANELRDHLKVSG